MTKAPRNCFRSDPTSARRARPVSVEEPLAQSLADLPKVKARLDRGQQFNAYESGDRTGLWYVGIGPVTDFYLYFVTDWRGANLLVDALRHAAGQSPALSRCLNTEAKNG